MAQSSRKPLFGDVAAELEAGFPERCLAAIAEGDFPFAVIGIDMAAQEDKWGLTVIALKRGLNEGVMRLTLPHRFDVEGFKKKHPIKPALELIRRILEALAAKKVVTAVAVDVPFGWPVEQADFLGSWMAVPGTNAVKRTPPRPRFEYRLCDRAMKCVLESQGRSGAVLSVAADKIACAAFQWAANRERLPGAACVDVGLEPTLDREISYLEAYPSAFVRLNYPTCAGYKKVAGVEQAGEEAVSDKAVRHGRRELLAAILSEYKIDLAAWGTALEGACESSTSDAFDGFLSAIIAWDYLKWRHEGESHRIRISSPTALLGERLVARESTRIRKEGWMLIRLPEDAEDASGAREAGAEENGTGEQ